MSAYEVRFRQVAIDGGDCLKIRSLRDRMQFSDRFGDAAAAGISSATWPHFGQLWPSACQLANIMQGWRLGSRRILEIGCGLGLASLVVHRRQGDVTASDCHPLTEGFLDANRRLNRLPVLKYLAGNWGRPNPALGRFDLIIGSDVLYERSHPGQLAEFLEEHAAESCEVLIVDPNRGHRAAFSRCMAGHGYALSEMAIETSLADGAPYRGRLLAYRRKRLAGVKFA
jgi:2-polyprenyl-3-methyl-5-hydroxy-6-metoxy-1,4-benzoquinol methylase